MSVHVTSAACAGRHFPYSDPASSLSADDLKDCQRLLSGIPRTIQPINNGLSTIQFQSLSAHPTNPSGDVMGGTQDNGTFSFTGSPTWLESVGGDGGQSGYDVSHPTTRFHNYFDATPEVNFKGNDPKEWLAISSGPCRGSSPPASRRSSCGTASSDSRGRSPTGRRRRPRSRATSSCP